MSVHEPRVSGETVRFRQQRIASVLPTTQAEPRSADDQKSECLVLACIGRQ